MKEASEFQIKKKLYEQEYLSKYLQSQKQIKYLRAHIKVLTSICKTLSVFHEATMDALEREKKGHNDGWAKVMKLEEKIEDTLDLSEFLP
jgi:hypothetical protein